MKRRDNIYGKPAFGPGAEPGEKWTAIDPPRSSWPIRTVQLLLAIILAFVVLDGLRRRARGVAVPLQQTKAVQPDARSHDLIVAQETNNGVAHSDASGPGRITPERSLTPIDEGLTSLNDLADYLALHRVAREAHRYELGSAAPEALMHLATTSGSQRPDTRADRNR